MAVFLIIKCAYYFVAIHERKSKKVHRNFNSYNISLLTIELIVATTNNG